MSLDLREWVNSGLMTFFFFVFGLEARREFDMGELRERAAAGAAARGRPGRPARPRGDLPGHQRRRPGGHGWGAAMSTDTAFALGMLALTRPRFPDRVRAFLLSVAVVDDLVSLVVIGAAYSRRVVLVPLAVAARDLRRDPAAAPGRGSATASVYALLGIAAWVAVLKSGDRPGGRRPGRWAC